MCQTSLTAIDWHAPVQDCCPPPHPPLRTRVSGMHVEARLCGYSVLHCLTHINKTSMLVMPTLNDRTVLASPPVCLQMRRPWPLSHVPPRDERNHERTQRGQPQRRQKLQHSRQQVLVRPPPVKVSPVSFFSWVPWQRNTGDCRMEADNSKHNGAAHKNGG